MVNRGPRKALEQDRWNDTPLVFRYEISDLFSKIAEFNLILRKNGSTGLRTMGLRRPLKVAGK